MRNIFQKSMSFWQYQSALLFVLSCLICSAFSLKAQIASITESNRDNSPNSPNFLSLKDLKAGQVGTAYTVFSGSEPEAFEVEIIGVVPGAIGPRQDMIIGRLRGANAERTAVFAGMSGSPVYIGGRLIGAISYSFPFSREPICGITPIEQMISIFENKAPSEAPKIIGPRSFTLEEATYFDPQKFSPAVKSDSVLLADPGLTYSALFAGQTFRPIALPLTFIGFSQKTLDAFATQLSTAGLMPVAAAGGISGLGPIKKADSNTLKPGASVAMQLTRGDYSIAAAGTVTYRDGNKIFAFGHPFLNLGTSDLPMSESHVVTVIPNLSNSFKLAVPDDMVGSMTQDRATGVLGELGRVPQMIPVNIKILTSRGSVENINYEVAVDPFLTPLLLNITIYNSLIAQERGFGDATVAVDGTLELNKGGAVKIERRYAGSQAALLGAGSIAAPASTILRNPLDGVSIKQINLTLSSIDTVKTATLERISIDKDRVRRGETLNLAAFARTNTGKLLRQDIKLQIPDDLPAGKLTITVADGAQILQASAKQQFDPRNSSELIKLLNNLQRSDLLYVQVSRQTPGAIIGASELTDLPPSVLATINNGRSSGSAKPLVRSIIYEMPLAESDFIINGKQALEIEVID